MARTDQNGKSGSSHLQPFEHTHLGVYFVGAFSMFCSSYDSFQGILEKYQINKQWYYLFGVLCMFAYISMRPLIRKGIGSASRGYINLYATYTMWLVSAVFHHLPSLADLGMDVKADLTIMVSVFFMTCVLIALLNGLHYVAVSMKYMPPFLFSPGAGPREVLSAVAVNSMSVAVACSTYFSFCGNAAGDNPNWKGGVKYAVCSKWLGPVPSDDFPIFKRWVLYGEGPSNSTSFVEYIWEAKGSTSVAPGKVISPVFMLWVTVFFMYLVNCLADSVAVQTMQVQHVSQLRRQTSTAALRKSGSSRVWYEEKVKPAEWDTYSVASFQSSSTGSEASFTERTVDRDNQPEFLPMVPWYSGTSADLVKTLFDITVSVKLFLGRFDMRTMLAARSSSKGSSPAHGDGLTFDHLMDREELWFDFCADTGDGGNSTYTVARALATPQLKVMRPTVKGEEQSVLLPRSDVLFLGGDLAYPGPSKETYHQRFFVPFQYALPPPAHDRRGRVVVHKPDIPEEWIKQEDFRGKKRDPLRQYEGPQCFAIPGNHDWHDGLETYIQQVLHRGWLGGWLLPQESSYFAVRLPHNWWLFGVDLALVNDIDVCQYRYFANVVEEQLSKDSQVILMSHQPIWLEEWMKCTVNAVAPNLRNLIRERLRGRCRIHLAGDLHFYLRHSLVPYKEGLKSSTFNMDVPQPYDGTHSEPQPTLNKIISQQNINNGDGELMKTSSSKISMESESEQCLPWGLDPEHLIVNGLGGAFLHPTHMFSGARFSGAMDTGNVWEREKRLHKGLDDSSLERRRSIHSPYEDEHASLPRAGVKWKGLYHCMQEYPSTEKSLELGQDNLHRFRLKNTRFDVVGALWYFLLVWSVLPCCDSTKKILAAPNFLVAAYQFCMQVFEIIVLIFTEKYVSLVAALLIFGTCYGFASLGGVGCAQPPASWTIAFNQGKPWLNGFQEDQKAAALRGYKVRTGGESMKFVFAALHAITHLTVAVILIQILEIGLFICIESEGLGEAGYHSMYTWFKKFLDEHFPDPMGLQRKLSRVSFGMYPGVLKYLMAAYDVPEAVAVVRIAICRSPSGWDELTRLQTIGYYLGMLGYYWLFAPPVMGLVFGLYLYISCCLFHLHPDEAFSALRIQNHKGFTRLHITPNGDLEVYSLAVDVVPTSWKEDVKWRGPFGGGNPECPAHKVEYPSRWVPKAQYDATLGYSATLKEEADFRVIDYLLVPRKQALRSEMSTRKSI